MREKTRTNKSTSYKPELPNHYRSTTYTIPRTMLSSTQTQPTPTTPQPQPQQPQCRYCHGSKGDLSRPCQCRGTSAYVHPTCLIESRRINASLARAKCEICRAGWQRPALWWKSKQFATTWPPRATTVTCMLLLCVLVVFICGLCVLAINALPAPDATKHTGFAVHGLLLVLMCVCIVKFAWLLARYPQAEVVLANSGGATVASSGVSATTVSPQCTAPQTMGTSMNTDLEQGTSHTYETSTSTPSSSRAPDNQTHTSSTASTCCNHDDDARQPIVCPHISETSQFTQEHSYEAESPV